MELIVVSDSHGMSDQVDKVVKNFPNADYYFHCGDSEQPIQLLSNFYAVEGNNDYYNEYPDHIILRLNDHFQVLVVHGHRQGVYGGLHTLASFAKRNNCNLVFYGHTHVYRVDFIDGVHVINPGCLLYNRDFTPGSFARVVIQDDKFNVERINTSSLDIE